ncbi:MAG: three-Cys-motif partner protein TcmP [Hyphomicrobiaceae bacterium]
MASTDKFFTSPQRATSAIKTKIVVEYFKVWASILWRVVRTSKSPRLRYVDLFAGPGKIDGVNSTPLLIIEHVISKPELCECVSALLNDEDAGYIKQLRRNLEELPGYEKLKFPPHLRTTPVDEKLVEKFANSNNIPSFSFIDPFGYTGLTLGLVKSLVSGFGSDTVLFFSFDSINRALTNELVKEHMDALFGSKRAERLRQVVKGMRPDEREELLIEAFIEAVTEELGYEYVIPYVFEKEDKDRTSHYLIFISKHDRGFKIMKDIMYKESQDKTQGIAKFGYVRQVSAEKTPLLYLMNKPRSDFGRQLCSDYAGRSLSREALSSDYDKFHPRNLFVERNWREVLSELESEGKITCVPPRNKRKVQNGEVTFGKNTAVTFPQIGKM